MNPKGCPICNMEMTYARVGSRDVYSVSCLTCGEYKITYEALANLLNTNLELRQRSNIYGWLRENPDYEITSYNLNRFERIITPSFHERADKILLFFDKKTSYAGKKIVKDSSWKAFSWSINDEELSEILSFLVSEGRITLDKKIPNEFVKIEPKGWSHLETLKKVNQESNQGFVAMWFSDEMKKIYDEVISVGISDAGYSPHRTDQREYNDEINDEIIAQIRKSRFVLADFTGHRGGVYFEAGFAKGLNLEVIWTCREDDIDKLHFDIRQYNFISWSDEKLDEFKKQITARIAAVMGRGKN